MLSVVYAECRYAECHYAECRYAECRYAECLGATKTPSLKFLSCFRFSFFLKFQKTKFS
jgi:hypothetical protein